MREIVIVAGAAYSAYQLGRLAEWIKNAKNAVNNMQTDRRRRDR